jgi:hypothetical protein
MGVDLLHQRPARDREALAVWAIDESRDPVERTLALMPSFMAIGIGGDLTIPLTATVLGVILTSRPPTRISSPWPDPRAGAVSRA